MQDQKKSQNSNNKNTPGKVMIQLLYKQKSLFREQKQSDKLLNELPKCCRSSDINENKATALLVKILSHYILNSFRFERALIQCKMLHR